MSIYQLVKRLFHRKRKRIIFTQWFGENALAPTEPLATTRLRMMIAAGGFTRGITVVYPNIARSYLEEVIRASRHFRKRFFIGTDT